MEGYETMGAVGVGGQGATYKCLRKSSGELGAVRYVSFHNDEDLEDFTMAISIEDPSLVQLMDVFPAKSPGGATILIKEFMTGGSLESVLELSRTQQNLALIAIGQGLCCLHEHGVVHVGLKPSNVLFDESLRVQDVGLGGSAPELCANDPVRRSRASQGGERGAGIGRVELRDGRVLRDRWAKPV
jgi:serine/threonine protein kinase